MIKLSGLTQEQTANLLPEGLIYLGWRGSIAHGMFVPSNDPNSIDDKDIMGVYVGPKSHYIGFGGKDTIEKCEGVYDAVFYEVRKFVGLLLKNNPNVLSLLWLPDNGVIYESDLGRLLVQNRDIFISKAAYHSFTGYAYSQLHRMTHMNQEVLQDIQTRKIILLNNGCTEEDGELKLPAGASPECMEWFKQYREIRGKYFKGYMGNKRRQLVEKLGYDSKNAAHLIRLQRMCIEFLTDGKLYVEREDKQELLAIKRGEWTLEKVKEEAERLFKLAQEAYVRSTLPAHPNKEAAEKLVMNIITQARF